MQPKWLSCWSAYTELGEELASSARSRDLMKVRQRQHCSSGRLVFICCSFFLLLSLELRANPLPAHYTAQQLNYKAGLDPSSQTLANETLKLDKSAIWFF